MRKTYKFIAGMVVSAFMVTSCGDNYNLEDYEFFIYEITALKEKKGQYFLDEDHKILFTGTAGRKNSSNQTMEYWVVDNGYISSKKNWQSVKGDRKLNADIQYIDGEIDKGWEKEFYMGNATSENDEELLEYHVEWEDGDRTLYKKCYEFGDIIALTSDLIYKNGKISQGFEMDVHVYEPKVGEGEGKIIITTEYKEYDKGEELEDKGWYLRSASYWFSWSVNGYSNYVKLGDSKTNKCDIKTKDFCLLNYYSKSNKSGHAEFFDSFFSCIKELELTNFHMHIYEE